ncbi:hypothetical protein ASPCAL10940 [Aspergillus calidoustus]|uniref:U3-containing 90S pre-ribosomal complex subunit-domain containing protein n=1 Tax=Aspergillus calidoustus TaxID=454130 RepID=A0A0U5CDB0_ASPCI|nr:hypothetical protein ASPCAL10940 [Aspergillus calidoustus]
MSSETPTPSGLAGKVDKKRKRQVEEPPKQNKTGASKPTSNASEGPKDKKRKHGKNKKEGNDKDQEDKPKAIRGEPLAKERKGGTDEAIGKMDGRLLADHFVQKAKRHNKDLTAVELSDLSVPDSAFLDTSSFDSPRTLDELPDFLKAFSPKDANLSDSSEQKGTPHTLVISPAGLRAADVVRALRTFSTKESPIGKLFAKHIKLEEAKQFLERARVGIGAGTPSRISDLIDSGSLKLNELKRIVIDGSYVDQKQRGIFDMKETHLPLLQLLARSEFRDRYGAKDKKVEILVF